jgi:hypothetical protein
MWQEAERQRLATLAERYKQELRRNEEWVDDGTQIRGQQYSWDLEGDMQVQQNVSSGAAGILHRPSLLEQREAKKGLPSTSSHLRLVPVNFSH